MEEILLNNTMIKVTDFKNETVNGLRKISVDFKVTSEDYHEMTTLLYKGTFDVKVPEQDLSFKAKIQEYSTSITNLYQKGQVGDYRLSLLEVES